MKCIELANVDYSMHVHTHANLYDTPCSLFEPGTMFTLKCSFWGRIWRLYDRARETPKKNHWAENIWSQSCLRLPNWLWIILLASNKAQGRHSDCLELPEQERQWKWKLFVSYALRLESAHNGIMTYSPNWVFFLFLRHHSIHSLIVHGWSHVTLGALHTTNNTQIFAV